MEFITFIFSSFWRWVGFTLTLLCALSGTAEIIKSCKRNRKVTAYRIGDRWHMEIENATREDVVSASFTKDAPEIVLANGEGEECTDLR